jgi:hypothetical protein
VIGLIDRCVDLIAPLAHIVVRPLGQGDDGEGSGLQILPREQILHLFPTQARFLYEK